MMDCRCKWKTVVSFVRPKVRVRVRILVQRCDYEKCMNWLTEAGGYVLVGEVRRRSRVSREFIFSARGLSYLSDRILSAIEEVDRDELERRVDEALFEAERDAA